MDGSQQKAPSVTKWVTKFATGLAFSLITGFTVVIVIPNFMRATLSKASNACVANLCQIDGAKQQWFLENSSRSNDIPTITEIAPYLKNNQLPLCPKGGAYVLGKKDEDPQCSIGGSAWPNDHVLNETNSWWTDFKAAYAALLGYRPSAVSR